MSTLYITEYTGLAATINGVVGVPAEPPLAEQTLAIGGSSVASAAFQPQTTVIRVHTDSICSVEIGAAPTATATTGRMAANQTEYRGVPRGAGYKIAVITNS